MKRPISKPSIGVISAAVESKFRRHRARGGAQAKAVAAEAKGVDQAGRGPAWAEHRQVVLGAALHSAPEADHGKIGDAGNDLHRSRQRGQTLLGIDLTEADIEVGGVAAPAEDDIAARNLACIDVAAHHGEHGLHKIGRGAR